jgi:recombination protein RecA
MALVFGFIVQTGAWFKVTKKDGTEEERQGFSGVQDFYFSNPDELEYLREEVYKATV